METPARNHGKRTPEDEHAMNISELKSTLTISDALILGYDNGGNSDIACLTVGQIEKDDRFRIIKCLHGERAIKLYHALTDI